MVRKHYSNEFHRQAVDLFESTQGATLQGIAADLRIGRGTLAHWVRALGSGTTTAPPGAIAPGSTSAPPGRVESPAARLVRLEAQVREREAEKVKLSTERAILRSAAKYFAGERNW